MEVTLDQLKELVGDAVRSAVAEIDKPAPTAAPPAPPAPAVNLRRYGPPDLSRAIRAAFLGRWPKGAELERDIAAAAAELWRYGRGVVDDDDPDERHYRGTRSVIWPRTRAEMAEVLYALGEKPLGDATRVESAIRALSEGTTAAGGALVPAQYLQDQFELALTAQTVVRATPGTDVIPVNSNIVYMPREATTAAGATVAEAASLTAADPTFAQQSINIRKVYRYTVASNELVADATPGLAQYLARAMARDVALAADLQYLTGNGTAPNILGFFGYGGLTAGPSTGANGSSPTFDFMLDAIYNLRAANVEPNAWIMHPRVLNSLAKLKDSQNRYLLDLQTPPNPLGVSRPFLLGLPVFLTAQLPINQTAGSSTDCTTVILGNFNYCRILDRSGIEFAVSEHVAFANDQTAFRAITRTALALTAPAAFELITGLRP
jgi:HK97 family phage major capsid protein